MKILIIEKEDTSRDILKARFLNEGWGVLTSSDGLEALQKVKTFKVDLVILDPMVPKLPSDVICKEIRKITTVPILVISSRSNEEDIVNALNLGADDYIIKPFRINEVLARIKALLRRLEMFAKKTQHVVCFNQNTLIINFETQEVLVDGRAVQLTSTEFKILQAFAQKPGKVFSRQDLSYIVQGYRFLGDARTMDAHIKNLRKKLEKNPRTPKYIVTKTGAGYKFNCVQDHAPLIDSPELLIETS
ncbi:response regulator transcription factor [Neobacillus kokaensis]|uniref:DNA-binding response regulator n=1 Tax=Neobacillus kokaensis TaxID=2759023 RepID=A0ABQ3N8X6_9BACI|nr:response regulator transcription factor [Neobacillus kokaensis]GHH97811.1 DNA-binding response regulator [Neobacillus kokaensis]